MSIFENRFMHVAELQRLEQKFMLKKIKRSYREILNLLEQN